jgi:hypothetical protein
VLVWQAGCALEVIWFPAAATLRATATLATVRKGCDMPANRNGRLRNGLKGVSPRSCVYRRAIAMTLLVKQRTPRHKHPAVVTGIDPIQVVLMIVVALAVTTLIALDVLFFFS